MKVGLFINTQFPEGFNLADRIPEMVAQVRSARDSGFAPLWFPHHWLAHPMQMLHAGVPYRIRTGVAAVRGRCPRPLDEGDEAVRRY